MCATFLKSMGYEIGQTFVDEERLDYARKLITTDKIVLPIDVNTQNGIKDIREMKKDDIIYDIGPNTIELFKKNLNPNTLTVINGTMGLYEEKEYSTGTDSIFKYLVDNHIKSIVCGGDTGSAAEKYRDGFYHISTGGGASLEYLEGKELPALSIME